MADDFKTTTAIKTGPILTHTDSLLPEHLRERPQPDCDWEDDDSVCPNDDLEVYWERVDSHTAVRIDGERFPITTTTRLCLACACRLGAIDPQPLTQEQAEAWKQHQYEWEDRPIDDYGGLVY